MSRSYDVVLTRTSDSLKLQGMLAQTAGGGGLKTVSTPYGGNPARHGRVVIGDGVDGSGQKVALNPRRYLSAEQFDCSQEGHVRSCAQGKAGVTVIDTTYANVAETARGAIFDALGKTFIIAPEEVYELSGTPALYTVVSSDTVAAGKRFTGSYAVFADRIFFGVEDDTTRASSTCRVWTATTVWVNAGFTGSYLTVVGSRMFVTSNAATNPRVSVKWTDEQGSSSPTMSTSYTYPTPMYAMDSARLDGALIVALSDSLYGGEVITLDIGGTFTNILAGFNVQGVQQFADFNGGVIAFVIGPLSQSLFFASLQNVSPLVVQPIDSTELLISSQVASLGAKTRLLASEVDRLFVGTKFADGTSQTTLLAIGPDGTLKAHNSPLPSPLSTSAIDIVVGSRIYATSSGARILEVVSRGGIGATENDITTWITPLYDGAKPYPISSVEGGDGNFDTSGAVWTSSTYSIDGFELAQILAISGRVALLNAGGFADEALDVYVNGILVGALAVVDGTLVGAGTPFRIELDENTALMAREVVVALVYTDVDSSGVMCDVQMPVYVDYVTVPNQYEEVTFNLTIGSLQINRAGGFTKQSKVAVMEILNDATANPEVWSAVLDNGDTWKVVPLHWQAADIEDATRPGEGTAVVALTCKRIRDTARILV